MLSASVPPEVKQTSSGEAPMTSRHALARLVERRASLAPPRDACSTDCRSAGQRTASSPRAPRRAPAWWRRGRGRWGRVGRRGSAFTKYTKRRRGTGHPAEAINRSFWTHDGRDCWTPRRPRCAVNGAMPTQTFSWRFADGEGDEPHPENSFASLRALRVIRIQIVLGRTRRVRLEQVGARMARRTRIYANTLMGSRRARRTRQTSSPAFRPRGGRRATPREFIRVTSRSSRNSRFK